MNTPLYILVAMLVFVVGIAALIASVTPETSCCAAEDIEAWAGRAREVEVVVVGGGVAGLAALNTLLKHNVTDVLLLEAQDRLGGRVRTYRQGDVLVEDGAEWIHGDARNSLYRLARSLGELDQNADDEDWDYRVMTEEGQPGDLPSFGKLVSLLYETDEHGILEPYYNDSYGSYYIDRFPKVFPPNTKHRKGLLHHLHQRVNGLEGTGSWLDIAARDADQYIDQGEDFQWKNGYDTLINHLKEKLPASSVRLSSPVSHVVWSSGTFPSRALVVTQGNETFLARHVLVTVSSAYLQKHHASLFQPQLPDNFIQSLKGVRLGVANKIQIGWPDPWWGSQPLELDILWTQFNLTHHMSWLYGIVGMFSVHKQRAVLEMFVTGDNSTYMEELQEDEVKDHVMYLVKGVTGQDIPQPTFFRRTRWSRDPWTLGSYETFITTEGMRGGLHNRNHLAAPIKNSAGHTVLLWAGEHTHNTRYGTVDGAMQTGQREAHRIVNLLKSS